MRCWSLAVAAAIGLALRGTSLAADPRFPDWPCNQIKVPEISLAAVWAGPSIDDVGNAWEEDATIRDLVGIFLLFASISLDPSHHVAAFIIEGLEQAGKYQFRLFLPLGFVARDDVCNRLLRVIEGRTIGGP